MLHASERDWFDMETVVIGSPLPIERAGADPIQRYFVEESRNRRARASCGFESSTGPRLASPLDRCRVGFDTGPSTAHKSGRALKIRSERFPVTDSWDTPRLDVRVFRRSFDIRTALCHPIFATL
ncbi:hypothetical protein [Halosolutus gelatinilyticus]|uniref:hypothetical protein n=1 Tax=Halosolutus gelatinilyticus TaxID=2931975 RepID=UPI003CE52318